MNDDGIPAMTDAVEDAACAWLAASARDDVDWAALTAWLDADPGHRAAFARMALLEREAADVLAGARSRSPAPRAAPTIHPQRRWRVPTLVAAAVAASAAVWLVPDGIRRDQVASAPAIYASAAGDRRALRLADGSHVLLDARSQVRVAPGGRHVELAAGAAWFEVRHDPARPFVVTIGPVVVRDVGTRFEVARGPGRVSVAVGEGAVGVDRTSTVSLQLRAGERVDWLGGGAGVLRRIDASGAGAWRSGRLVYDRAPLALVADDIARYAGRPLMVDPRLAGTEFTGVITIGDGTRLVERLRALLPIETVETPKGIQLVPRGGA